MSTTTTTRPRRPLQPATGSVKVLRPLGDVNASTGEVLVNGKPYYLAKLEHGFRLRSFNSKKEQVTVYDLPADLSSCDCPDATYRGERPQGCKHRKALLALQAAGKL